MVVVPPMMRDDGFSLTGFFLIGLARFQVKPMASVVDCFRLGLDADFAVIKVVEGVDCKGCKGDGRWGDVEAGIDDKTEFRSSSLINSKLAINSSLINSTIQG